MPNTIFIEKDYNNYFTLRVFNTLNIGHFNSG